MADLAPCPLRHGRVLVLPRGTAQRLTARLPSSPDIPMLSKAPPDDVEAWRFETSDGSEINLPLSAARAWERPPYAMLVRLSADGPDRAEDTGRERRIIAEAVIGTRGEFDALQDRLLSTMIILLRSALDDRAAGPAIASPPPVPALRQPLRLALLEGWLRRAAHRWQERLFAEHWAIGIVAQSVGSLVEGEPLAPVAWIDPGQLGDLADPHPWPGTTRILCEEIPRTLPRSGRIMALELDAGSPPRVAAAKLLLGGRLHRSFPGAHVHGNEVLLLPETPARGETTIYAMADDGALAPICRVAPHLRMGDPTLFWHGGLAWIAYTDLDLGVHDSLCLLHAPHVRGPWQPHRRNPVKIDIRSARPAGPLLRHRGALYRPAQDCARDYGTAVVLHRVETLTTELFREALVRRIEPSRGGRFPHGLHTLAADGDRILVDGKHLVPRPIKLVTRTWRRAVPAFGKSKVLADA